MGVSSSKKIEEEAKRQEEEVKRRREEAIRQEQRIRIEQIRRIERLRQLEEDRKLLQEYERRAALRRESERLEDTRRSEGRRQLQLFLDNLKQEKVEKNFQMVNELRIAFGLNSLSHFPDTLCTQNELLECSGEYNKIRTIFRKTNKPFFYVTQIMKIDNPFLALHYQLALNKFKENEEDDHYCEKIMFHGTKCQFLDNICNFNFDRSKVKTHKFGHGVSFATNSFYATHYHHDNMRRKAKVMILAKVFYENEDLMEIGGPYTIIPEEPYYTTKNKDASVYVKYDDASFYPVYVVHYEGLHPPKQR